MKVDKKNTIFIGIMAALGCEVMYGLSYFFTKQATESAAPLALLGWRFLVALIAINICLALGLIKVNLRGKDYRPLVKIALYFPVAYFIGETLGIGNTTASESGVILACIPVAALAASALILGKTPTKWQVVGIVITLVGVLINVLAVGTSTSFSAYGYICLLAAVMSYAMYSVHVEKASDFTGMEITYVMLMVAALVFVPLSIVSAVMQGSVKEIILLPFSNLNFIVAVLYQGIFFSVLAVFLGNVAIAKIGVNRASSFIGVSTVVSIIAGAFILKEPFTIYQTIGAIIIVGGVYIANAGGKNIDK